MCLIGFAYKCHSKYDLVFVANRDEAYRRPTRPAQFWDENPNILAGKDLQAGGTWMGINKRGHFAALTNYRDPSISKKNPPSRGELVLNYLNKNITPSAYLDSTHHKADQYMGFNILAGNHDELLHYSNQQQQINRVEPGIHGLSNHLLDTPWPKVKQAKTDLMEVMNKKHLDEELLFELLQNDMPADDEHLPDTGIGKGLEKQVSPVFIKSKNYGTRSSTILLIAKNGQVTFEERRFKTGTLAVDEINRFEFEIERGA